MEGIEQKNTASYKYFNSLKNELKEKGIYMCTLGCTKRFT